MALGQREHNRARLAKGRDPAAVLKFDRRNELLGPGLSPPSAASGAKSIPRLSERAAIERLFHGSDRRPSRPPALVRWCAIHRWSGL
jgi:hypothetical protein